MSYESQAEQAFRDPQWYFARLACNIAIRAKVARHYIASNRPKRILDIGCGNGAISVPFLSQGVHLTLLDRSKAMLALAQSRVPKELAAQVDTVNVDVTAAPLEPGVFDLVVCLGVLPYVEDAAPFVRKVSSLLTPGGILITECTDYSHPVTRFRICYGKVTGLVRPPNVRTYIRPGTEIVRAYQDCGLTLKAIYRYCLPPPLIGKFFTEEFHERMTYRIFGSPVRNRLAWLGNENIYHFVRETDEHRS